MPYTYVDPMFQNVSRTPDDVEPSEDELLTDEELRKFLKASRTTIWRLRTRRGLPHSKVGGRYRYLKSDVLRWLEASNSVPRDEHK